jgi:hypothetical protein
MADTDDRLTMLWTLLRVVGGLPPELVILILYRHGGLMSPSALAWHTEPGHTSRLEIHYELVAHRAVGASESRCWCADFSISSLLAELHAFGTPHQSAFSQTAARHSDPPRFPDTFTTYRRRCAMASLLTRVATAAHPTLADRVPTIAPRIGRDASAPFLPVSSRLSHAAILPWYARARIPVLPDNPTDPGELARLYYAWEGDCDDAPATTA